MPIDEMFMFLFLTLNLCSHVSRAGIVGRVRFWVEY